MIRRALRWRYQLLEVAVWPAGIRSRPVGLGTRERVVSRHWFRFAATQARISAMQNHANNVVPEMIKRGQSVPLVSYTIVPIG